MANESSTNGVLPVIVVMEKGLLWALILFPLKHPGRTVFWTVFYTQTEKCSRSISHMR